jgi:regulatory protein
MKSESEMLSALARYCSQGERCLNDVRKKIRADNIPEEAEKRIIDRLLQEKFVDENRYSRSFVHDKFRLNHWGRIKIGYELKLKGIPPEIYREAMETIDEDEYLRVLTELFKSKKRTIKSHSPQDMYQKLFRFAAARGFETEYIINTLKKMLKNIDDDESLE